MNYRKYFLSGLTKRLISVNDANDVQIYNKLNRILYEADLFYRTQDLAPYTVYDNENMKKFYAMSPQFRALLHEANSRDDIKRETLIEEILKRLK